MTLPAPDGTKNWLGRTVVDRNGAEIGVCAALLTDTESGQPEWLEVERHDVTLIVPLLDAHESGGRVHVTVTRAYADGAPRFGATRELTRDQEAALYRHYGIEYSKEASDSLLPADAQSAGALPTAAEGAAPGTAVHQLVTSDAVRRSSGIAAGVAVLVGLATAVVAAVRMRRGAQPGPRRLRRRAAPPPRPAAGPLLESASRLAGRSASAGAQSLRRAAVHSAAWGSAASSAARTYTDVAATRLGPLFDTTALAAWRAVRAGTDSALRVTDAATEAVVAAVPRVTASTALAGRTGLVALARVGAAAEAVPEVVAGTGERLGKGWRHAMGRLSLGLGFGIGYVLGARAGRARYEQITQAAAGFVERPEVREALERAKAVAPPPLQSGIDKLSGRGSATGMTDVGGAGGVAAPPPPASGTGSPRPDAPLPDPLTPPARSGDAS